MAIKLRSKKEIIENIQTSIRTDSGDGIATYENSSAYDIFINPSAELVIDSDVVADFISRSRSLNELERVIRDAQYQDRLRYALNYTFQEVQQYISSTLDNLVSNWNEERRTAQKAKGFIKLYFRTNSPVTLSSGLIFKTDNNVSFQTTNSFTAFTPFYDSIEGLYYVECSIEAVLSGQSGNVEAGSIINIVSSTSNLQKVVNLERTKFGKEIETDLQLIDRVRNSWKSRNTTVLSGFVRKLFNYPGVIDLSIVMAGDSEQKRNEKNAVDIYIISEENPQLKEDTFNSVSARYAWERIDDEINYEIYPTNYDSTSTSSFKLLSQPVMSISEVSYSTSPSGSYSIITSPNYEYVADTTSGFAQSVKGHDYIRINNSALPNNTWVKVSYSYDRLFKDLQSLFLSYNNAIIGADLLFKKATSIDVNISAVVKLFSGFNTGDVQSVISSDLNIFFSGGIDSNGIERLPFKLGQKVDKSDILNVIIDVEGVDSVDIDSFTITINDEEVLQTYTPKINEYLSFGTITFLSLSGGSVTPIKSFINIITE